MILETDYRAVAAFEALNDKDIDITLMAHRDKRNLDQNALYWSVVGEIALATNQSTSVIHNLMLRRYGFPLMYGGQIVYAMIPDGTVRRTYMIIRGSHDYNTKEMSRLIDGAISEAKEMGVVLHE